MFQPGTNHRREVPDRPDYAPRTAETSIAVDEVLVGSIDPPFSHDRYITVLGDGTVRYATTEGGPETHMGHASSEDVAHVLNELASIDFLEFRCEDGRKVDHGRHVSVSLTVRGTQNSVELDDCVGERYAAVGPLVKELEQIAERATADDHAH